MARPLKMAVLLSGSGRTLANFAEHISVHQLPAQIKLVISSKAQAQGLSRAANLGLQTTVVDPHLQPSPDILSELVFEKVRGAGAQLVCLAGWLWLLRIPDDFVNRVVNIHPALLPSFGGKGMYGHHVHEAVLAAGCKVSGCTVHMVNNTYDTGPIIVQRTCEVCEDDTPQSLATRVFEQECIAYPQAIRLIAENRVKVLGQHMHIGTPTKP